jgi:hypothetical protein
VVALFPASDCVEWGQGLPLQRRAKTDRASFQFSMALTHHPQRMKQACRLALVIPAQFPPSRE